MLLITSGAYVDSELYAEFGRIPPAFLPVGNRPLFTWQAERHGAAHAQVCMTVPGDFTLDEADCGCLDACRIALYRTEPGVALGVAVHDFLSAHEREGPIEILYGDTLIDDPPRQGSDWLAVGHTDEYYHWYHEVPSHGQPGGTWTGMFAFSDAARLRALLAGRGDFIASVLAYDRDVASLAHWQVARWLDFGHVHTYFDSKRTVTTERHFNQLRVADGVVTKTGDDAAKIAAEAEWFEQAPATVKPFLAPYIGRTDNGRTANGRTGQTCGYQLEYLHLATLNELYVFGRLPARVWGRIFRACDAFLQAARAVPVEQPPTPEAVRQTYRDKTLSRLAAYAAASGCDLDAPWTLNGQPAPSLREMAAQASAALEAAPPEPSFLHGDFCFSNILFDFRAGRVKTIDPRGTDAHGRPARFGDLRYDVGKLAHSVLGLYDHIVAGHYLLETDAADPQALRFRVLADRSLPIQALFLATPFAGRLPAAWDCLPVMVLLFLSMLPLHADSGPRQRALMANAIRLYLIWRTHDRDPDGGTEPPLL
jgi:hypothetical protein